MQKNRKNNADFSYFICVCHKKAVPLHSELSTEDHNLRVGTGRESGFFIPSFQVYSLSLSDLLHLPISNQM